MRNIMLLGLIVLFCTSSVSAETTCEWIRGQMNRAYAKSDSYQISYSRAGDAYNNCINRQSKVKDCSMNRCCQYELRTVKEIGRQSAYWYDEGTKYHNKHIRECQ